ncbi:hypothetical protein G4D82_14085 [Flavobacterium sp. CYK-4]|uniref:hypothetical protein n=1 Tax=Flavobacterium lotistagni TaxID=2709660 RepID=UPI0014074CBE|nr:hypothetical protein [Flavobacterium lotistagni]NHM08354.1 hypothetical protein [Flavobacterium lotistagni]
MKYNKAATISHTLSTTYPCCVKDFNQVILEEDDNLVALPNYFTNVNVIDLDCVELNKAKAEIRPQNKTMDTTFVISNTTTAEMLLVELRFNYRNLSNLDRNELLGKVVGSVLLCSPSVINNNYIFIFQSNLVQQARSRLQRMNPRIPNNYIAMDLAELIATYF